jgi:hypothetical protein
LTQPQVVLAGAVCRSTACFEMTAAVIPGHRHAANALDAWRTISWLLDGFDQTCL